MVVSFSLEPATASLMPSREAIWLSLSHRSSSLAITNQQRTKSHTEAHQLDAMRWAIARSWVSYLVSFSISSIDVSLFDETSKTRRFTKVDKPSILEMPLWLRYNSSSVTHSCNYGVKSVTVSVRDTDPMSSANKEHLNDHIPQTLS